MTLKTLLASTALLSFGLASALATADEITVVSWGGVYAKSQLEAFHKPWMNETGHRVLSVDSDNPAAPIKAQVEAGNVSIDIADIEYSDAVRYCDEGLLEPIDATKLAPAPDGSPAKDDFIAGGIMECGVANVVWSSVFAYDVTRFPTEKPQTIADFFDTQKFPGKRGLRKGAKTTLEIALLGDGVPPSQVYELLATEEGLARAFAKLDTIKKDAVWWEAGAQPPQLLADGEVVMTMAYNGRIFDAAVGEGKPFQTVWDGQILDFDVFVVPKGAPNRDQAMEFIRFATDARRMASQATWISYGPARKSALSLVGKYLDGKTDMIPYMPTSAENMKNALVSDSQFWVDRDTELGERFNVWLSAN